MSSYSVSFGNLYNERMYIHTGQQLTTQLHALLCEDLDLQSCPSITVAHFHINTVSRNTGQQPIRISDQIDR